MTPLTAGGNGGWDPAPTKGVSCVFLEGPHWQAWEGRLAVGFLRGARIELLQVDAEGMTTQTATIADLPSQRMRSLVSGPDGAIYVATDAGEIWQLSVRDKRAY